MLRGERKPASAVQDERYYRRECVYGPFQRSFVLPATVDQTKVQARYHDGILELHLPKVEAAKPRRIAITG
jgi:HSP20 family protein